ncbi:Uncharacterised protein [Vibrio cholerae]|nr:Uncharacterised protein [Vibrio cholerae]
MWALPQALHFRPHGLQTRFEFDGAVVINYKDGNIWQLVDIELVDLAIHIISFNVLPAIIVTTRLKSKQRTLSFLPLFEHRSIGQTQLQKLLCKLVNTF